MYGKLFSQMYDGTLGTEGPWQALVTFQQLVILSDRHGVVDMTAEAISRRTTLPLDVIKAGLKVLVKPDPNSRTPDEQGRRIVQLSDDRNWGWRIVNYEKYRKIRSADERREYMRQYMKDSRANVNNVSRVSPKQPMAVSSKQDAKEEKKSPASLTPKSKALAEWSAIRASIRNGATTLTPNDPITIEVLPKVGAYHVLREKTSRDLDFIGNDFVREYCARIS